MVSPASVKIRVMPRLRPTKPIAISKFLYVGPHYDWREPDTSDQGVGFIHERSARRRLRPAFARVVLDPAWAQPRPMPQLRLASANFGRGEKGAQCTQRPSQVQQL